MEKKDLKLRYVFNEQCQNDVVDALKKKLREYNASKIKDYNSRDYFFGYYDENDNLIAGLYACCRLGKFHIDYLWVDESFRKTGLGTKLLKQAEEIAIKNKVLYIRLNSGTFQAPDFYLKNGYQIFAKLPILTNGNEEHYDYYFVKYLK